MRLNWPEDTHRFSEECQPGYLKVRVLEAAPRCGALEFMFSSVGHKVPRGEICVCGLQLATLVRYP